MPWKGRDVSKFSFPTPVTWIHYTDDIMLTCEDLPLLQKTLQALLDHLQQRGQAVNPQKIQGPSTEVKFLGVVWLGKIHISTFVSEAITKKIQACSIPKIVKQVQAFVRILGYW